MVKSKSIGLGAALGALMVSSAVVAQQRTGSHLDSRTARPTLMHLNEPSELDEVLYLIEAGRNQKAVEVARDHVQRLKSVQLSAETRVPESLYYALNALCVALTTTGQTDEALDTCSAAIAESPRQWAAWNSRGTTYFSTGNFDEALDDFSRAAALAPENADIVDTISFNIRLTHERIAGN